MATDEWKRARDVLLELLRSNPNDLEASLALAEVNAVLYPSAPKNTKKILGVELGKRPLLLRLKRSLLLFVRLKWKWLLGLFVIIGGLPSAFGDTLNLTPTEYIAEMWSPSTTQLVQNMDDLKQEMQSDGHVHAVRLTIQNGRDIGLHEVDRFNKNLDSFLTTEQLREKSNRKEDEDTSYISIATFGEDHILLSVNRTQLEELKQRGTVTLEGNAKWVPIELDSKARNLLASSEFKEYSSTKHPIEDVYVDTVHGVQRPSIGQLPALLWVYLILLLWGLRSVGRGIKACWRVLRYN